MGVPSTQTAHRDFSHAADESRWSTGSRYNASYCRSHCDTRLVPFDSLCARFSLALTIPSLHAPTNLASALGSLPEHMPPAHHKIFSLIHFPQCVSLSSAYPFSACSNRQPFVFKAHERVRLPISCFHTY